MQVISLIFQRLDYCNSVLAGLPASSTRPLQRIQNAAASLDIDIHICSSYGLNPVCSCAQMLVPRLHDQSALGCRSKFSIWISAGTYRSSATTATFATSTLQNTVEDRNIDAPHYTLTIFQPTSVI